MVGGGLCVLLLGMIFLFNKNSFNPEQNMTHINIVAAEGNVVISAVEDDQLDAYLVGENGERLTKGFKLKLKSKKEELIVKAKKTAKIPQNYTVVVELPNKLYEEIEVATDVGNIELAGPSAASYFLKTSVGSMTVNVPKGMIQAKTQVGNLHFQVADLSSDLVAITEVGNIYIETKDVPEALQVDYKTNVGTANIELPHTQSLESDANGPSLQVQTDVGDISLILKEE